MLNFLTPKQAHIYTTDISKRHSGIQALFLDPQKIHKTHTHTHFLFGEVLLRCQHYYKNYISSKKGHLQQMANAENTCSASKRSFCRMARRGLGSKSWQIPERRSRGLQNLPIISSRKIIYIIYLIISTSDYGTSLPTTGRRCRLLVA